MYQKSRHKRTPSLRYPTFPTCKRLAIRLIKPINMIQFGWLTPKTHLIYFMEKNHFARCKFATSCGRSTQHVLNNRSKRFLGEKNGWNFMHSLADNNINLYVVISCFFVDKINKRPSAINLRILIIAFFVVFVFLLGLLGQPLWMLLKHSQQPPKQSKHNNPTFASCPSGRTYWTMQSLK